ETRLQLGTAIRGGAFLFLKEFVAPAELLQLHGKALSDRADPGIADERHSLLLRVPVCLKLFENLRMSHELRHVKPDVSEGLLSEPCPTSSRCFASPRNLSTQLHRPSDPRNDCIFWEQRNSMPCTDSRASRQRNVRSILPSPQQILRPWLRSIPSNRVSMPSCSSATSARGISSLSSACTTWKKMPAICRRSTFRPSRLPSWSGPLRRRRASNSSV